MVKEEKEQGQAGVAEEETLLESLFSKVDMTVPSEAVDLKDKATLEPPSAKLSVAINHFFPAISSSGAEISKLDKVLVESTIAEIDRRLSDQIGAIMHNEQFQKMESSWRSLKFLVDRTNFRRNMKIEQGERDEYRYKQPERLD